MNDTDLPTREIRRAYRDTLEEVLTEVETLLLGKGVVTSDRGDALGELSRPTPAVRRKCPSGHYVDELVEAAWHVVSNGPRENTTEGDPTEDAGVRLEGTEEVTRNSAAAAICNGPREQASRD